MYLLVWKVTFQYDGFFGKIFAIFVALHVDGAFLQLVVVVD